MFTFILLLALLGLLFLNRQLYLEHILFVSQLRVYAKHFRLRKRRLRFSESFRRLWVWASRLSSAWQDACLALQPATVIAWERRRYRDFWTLQVQQRSYPGRPPIPQEEIDLIIQMTTENPGWSTKRIQGELKKLLGFTRHLDTIRAYMPKRSPDPTCRIRWAQFLKLNLPRIAAMDFFLIPRSGKRLPLLGFFVISHERRRLLHINVTEHPTAEWLSQQFLLAFGSNSKLRLLVQDNDALFRPVQKFLQSIQIRSVKTAYRSPWMNGIAERFVRTLREDLLDFVVVQSVQHIRTLLLEYRDYYNQDRTHSSLDLDTPDGRAEQAKPSTGGRLVRLPRVRGLHGRYEWRDSA